MEIGVKYFKLLLTTIKINFVKLQLILTSTLPINEQIIEANWHLLILTYYLLLSVLLISSGDSGITPGFPIDSNGLLNGEIHLNQAEIQMWLLNFHLISGGQIEEGSIILRFKGWFKYPYK